MNSILYHHNNLGIVLKSCYGNKGAYVSSILHDNQKNSTSINLSIGSVIIAINDIDICTFSINDIVSLIRNSKRPIIIHYYYSIIDLYSIDLIELLEDSRKLHFIKEYLIDLNIIDKDRSMEYSIKIASLIDCKLLLSKKKLENEDLNPYLLSRSSYIINNILSKDIQEFLQVEYDNLKVNLIKEFQINFYSHIISHQMMGYLYYAPKFISLTSEEILLNSKYQKYFYLYICQQETNSNDFQILFHILQFVRKRIMSIDEILHLLHHFQEETFKRLYQEILDTKLNHIIDEKSYEDTIDVILSFISTSHEMIRFKQSNLYEYILYEISNRCPHTSLLRYYSTLSNSISIHQPSIIKSPTINNKYSWMIIIDDPITKSPDDITIQSIFIQTPNFPIPLSQIWSFINPISIQKQLVDKSIMNLQPVLRYFSFSNDEFCGISLLEYEESSLIKEYQIINTNTEEIGNPMKPFSSLKLHLSKTKQWFDSLMNLTMEDDKCIMGTNDDFENIKDNNDTINLMELSIRRITSIITTSKHELGSIRDILLHTTLDDNAIEDNTLRIELERVLETNDKTHYKMISSKLTDLIHDNVSSWNLSQLIIGLLLEYRIVICSSKSYNAAYVLCEWIKQSIYPLEYCHIFSPSLPLEHLENIITCPMPYLVGIYESQNYNSITYLSIIQDKEDVLFYCIDSDSFLNMPHAFIIQHNAMCKSLTETLQSISKHSLDDFDRYTLGGDNLKVSREYRIQEAISQFIQIFLSIIPLYCQLFDNNTNDIKILFNESIYKLEIPKYFKDRYRQDITQSLHRWLRTQLFSNHLSKLYHEQLIMV